MNTRTLGCWTGVFAAALLAAGCGGSNTESQLPQSTTGTLSIGITDAPVDEAAAVVIAMTEFEFKPVGDEPPFTVAVEGAPRQLNLLDFTNGDSEIIIDGEEVPAGDYEWLRIYFDEAASFVQLETDGTMYPLFIPSGAQTGYKLVQGFTVPLNDSVLYMIDFDVRKSLIEPPGLGGPTGNRTFLLRPTARIVNTADAGSVSGIVDQGLIDVFNPRCADADPPLTGNAVYVFEGADAELDDVADEDTDGRAPPLTSDVVEQNAAGDYEYMLKFLLPGTYKIAFTCSGMADGATDDDFPVPTDEGAEHSGFDFDAEIVVEIESNVEKSCPIPAAEGATEPC